MNSLLSLSDQEQKNLAEFEEVRQILTEWGDFVDKRLHELTQLLDDSTRIKLPPKSRIKTNYSYIRKAIYRDKTYENPIVDIEDKIATRVVLMTSKDVHEFKRLVENDNNWNYKVSRDYNEEILNKPAEFAYQSVHIVVSPLTSYPIDQIHLQKVTCEIQIRSYLQHAFSEVSHDTTYKGPFKNDKKILRLLSTSMAFMEATDDYFCKIFDLMLDTQRKHTLFLAELTKMYAGLRNGFDPESTDVEIADNVLSLLNAEDVSIDDLHDFLKKKGEEITETILPKNGILFQQPVIILIAYFLYNLEGSLRDHWPLSNDALNGVYRSFGISTNSMRFTN
ncbi:GTP pyrophosphokinase [Dyadobacter fanqingshengii]|uniref:RelA/SpoT domain-containing protein n=1 Tax=Dyadobacter fanqingshengii TaxID=2906443 RepID=A0A9X1PHG7_9BACT|nr:RelA/SpoT domain-containing protein [Dyadobacter fanqingshengii]MCF0043665.1 RelA/SpoT domain-containing protein [Dyadobacter fanqingshengii]USJ34719.1 RelA/SpoT domain-containing protein [Dyadobacter fanqingshengii]